MSPLKLELSRTITCDSSWTGVMEHRKTRKKHINRILLQATHQTSIKMTSSYYAAVSILSWVKAHSKEGSLNRMLSARSCVWNAHEFLQKYPHADTVNFLLHTQIAIYALWISLSPFLCATSAKKTTNLFILYIIDNPTHPQQQHKSQWWTKHGKKQQSWFERTFPEFKPISRCLGQGKSFVFMSLKTYGAVA